MELETKEHYEPKEIMERIVKYMPEGVELLSCTVFPREMKSLAASACEAEYSVVFPIANDIEKYTKILSGYLSQERITAQKRQKKDKENGGGRYSSQNKKYRSFRWRKIDLIDEARLRKYI